MAFGHRADVAQLVEQRFRKPPVGSSSLPVGSVMPRVMLLVVLAVAAGCVAPTVAPTGAATATVSTGSIPTTRPPATTSSPLAPPTAAPNPSTASSASLPPGASLPPLPSQPPLSSDTARASAGTITFAIDAGATRRFEPQELAAAAGASPVPSAALAWTIAWRATEPLSAAWYRQTATIELGRGRFGTADLGGAGFLLRNDGASRVYGELSFVVGTR